MPCRPLRREKPDVHGGIAGAVARWAMEEPAACALIDGATTLSRDDLLRWSVAAGDMLRRLARPVAGEGPGVCAMVLPRSWAVPFGLIAARFAGLAFILLDADEATPRLVAALATARPALVVTMAGAAAVRAACTAPGLTPDGMSISLTPPHPALEGLVVQRFANGRRLPPGTGHLVFTSGSSGRPKAVLLRDAPLLRTAAAQRRLLGTDGSGRDARRPSVWVLSPAFDASLSDIFCAILGTAPLLVSRDGQARRRTLAALIARHDAARADLSPALLRLLSPHALGLSAVIFGGEPCDPAAAIRWGTATLALQAYGPTEAAVCAMIARAGPHWRPALLGRPLDHQIVLLSTAAGVFRVLPRDAAASVDDDAAFNATILVPYGDGPAPPDGMVEGEILLAGDAIAIGYLDAPQDGFGLLDGLPVHHTGDIARWKGGALAWRGRADRQLNLRGRRIAPEEVELVASAAWGASCACVAVGDHLILALEGRDGGGDPDAVATAIEHALGRAFCPRKLIVLRPWPRLPSGKTDFGTLTIVATSAAYA